MRIVLKKWGGFTGEAGAEVHELRTDTLAPEGRARVEKLVNDASFFTLPEKLLNAAPQPWDFKRRLTIEDGGRSRSIEFHHDAGSPALRALVGELEGAAGG